MSEEWSGLYCRHCGYEASKKVAARGRGYCLDCGRRLGNLSNGQKNPYPIKHRQPAEGSASNAR